MSRVSFSPGSLGVESVLPQGHAVGSTSDSATLHLLLATLFGSTPFEDRAKSACLAGEGMT